MPQWASITVQNTQSIDPCDLNLYSQISEMCIVSDSSTLCNLRKHHHFDNKCSSNTHNTTKYRNTQQQCSKHNHLEKCITNTKTANPANIQNTNKETHNSCQFFLHLTSLTSHCRSNTNLDAAIVSSDLQPT